ncbi:hypothetical protein, partial [Mycobacterium sp. 1465703.0]|uniref:hypothetical protein n=1 Tax=Mycobacterium sp. 1465703.0 TaxID=1834078 RepID=UPI000B1D9259
MSGNQFGGPSYTQPETRELSSITESPNPDASDFASAEKVAVLLQRHDYQIKALAQGQQQLQQGVNDATDNPIKQIQQFIADVVVLLGGGEITQGVLDFGDLQYILPTLGALFGLGDAPFPVDLFQAAEKFFFGYVVPNQQFTDEINTIIGNWAATIGIDPEFVADLKTLITGIGDLFGTVGNVLPSVAAFFGELGIDANDLGPLGQLLAPIIKFFSGIDLKDIGNLLKFVSDALDPVIKDLTAVVNFLNALLTVFNFEASGSGGVLNSPVPELTVPFENLMEFLGDINLGSGDFDPIEAAYDFIDRVLAPTGLLPTAQQIAAAISGLTGQNINLDDVSTFFTNLRAFLTGIDFNVADFDPLAAAEQFINNVLNPTGLLASATAIAQAITGLTGDGITLNDVQAFFGNLKAFFGGIDLNAGDFDPLAAAEQFITTVLDRTGLLTTVESIGQDITGIENATGEDISKFFANLKTFMAGVDLNAADFDPIAAAETLINDVLNPTGLLMSITSPIS